MKTLFAGLIVLFTMSGCVSIPSEAFASGRVAIGRVAPGPNYATTNNSATHSVAVDPASQAAYDREVNKVAKTIQKRKDCIARNKAWTDHGKAPKYRCGADTYPVVRWTSSGNRWVGSGGWRQGYPYRSAYPEHRKKRH